jgi:adenylate kinase
MHAVFYGPEGSGKSTQAQLLAKKLNIPILSSGDLVRKYAKEDQGIMGDICRQTLKKGHYVADSEMYVLWKHRLKAADAQKGWIIEGFPRNLTQAKFLERKIEKYGHKLDFVFYVKVSPQTSMKRLLKRGRHNPSGELHDSEERIEERLKRYRRAKAAVLNYYQGRGILEEIDGEKSIEAVHQDILKRVKNKK